MNFPYETEKSYLYGGNCLIMEVNPSVPNKPISKKSRIFASDYQYMETDIITVSDFEMRPVDYMLARSIEHAKAKQTKMYAISLRGKSAETSYLQLCDKYWKVIIEDTGIGIPSSEQSKLFKLHFRASNAINSKVTGSGIGLMLVGKLVRLHGGKINVESIEHQGTTVRIVFPKSNKHFQNAGLIPPAKPLEQTPELTVPNISATPVNTVETTNSQRILIVEDNDELRSYLISSLSSMYHVQACGNGREALIIAKEFWPDLILSDIMMPEMRGDELCVAIKNDIETSHIPVLLLTALGDENNILDGMSIGADAYIVKPFNVRILKASIANLLANRALLRSRYANLDIDSEPMIPSANGTTSLDWQFISAVKKSIEENMDNTGFSVDVLCELHHMSRTSFYCKLKALTGQSPTDLIRITRLKRATQLLKEGGHTIAEISDMTGFSESKYFREVFKKHYKMSPTKYAKEGSNSSPIITEDNLSDD